MIVTAAREAAERAWEEIAPRLVHGKFICRAICMRCGAHEEWRTDVRPSKRKIKDAFRKMGWLVGAKRTECTECKVAAARERGWKEAA